DMPVWVPPLPDSAGFATVNINRALSKGLTFRSIPDTTRATLDWFHAQPADRQAKLRAGITSEREKEVLAAWHAAKKQRRTALAQSKAQDVVRTSFHSHLASARCPETRN